MKFPLKVTLVTAAVVIALLLAAFLYVLINQKSNARPGLEGAGGAQIVRSTSHVLDDGGVGAVTVVEFLDFECEACGAFYPIVENLRDRLDGDITYVVRYFPLDGHLNSRNAAIAAEAAAQQDRFEDMYHRLFATQAEWGESQESRADVFRGFAAGIGLDMTAYDEAVADPATAARVQIDVNDGRALGVSSTPTFFVDGEVVQLQQFDDLENAIESARAGGQR